MSNYNFVYFNANTDMDQGVNDGYEYYAIDCSGSNITITLPTITYDGVYYLFHRIDTSGNTLTLQAQTGQTVRGGASITLGGNRYIQIVSYGSDWLAPL